MPNAITLLRNDHAKVRKLLEQLDKAHKAIRRDELLEQIVAEVELHARIEEEIFYPAFRDAGRRKDDAKLYFEAQAEHAAVRVLMPELQRTPRGSDEFAGKAKVLKDLIEHHAEQEETELFPRARILMSAEDLDALGERIEGRKQELHVAAS